MIKGSSSGPAVSAPNDTVTELVSEGSSGTPLPGAVIEVNGEEEEEEMEEDELDEDEVEGEGYGECCLRRGMIKAPGMWRDGIWVCVRELGPWCRVRERVRTCLLPPRLSRQGLHDRGYTRGVELMGTRIGTMHV